MWRLAVQIYVSLVSLLKIYLQKIANTMITDKAYDTAFSFYGVD